MKSKLASASLLVAVVLASAQDTESVRKIPMALKEVHRGMNFGFLAKNGYYGSKDGLAQVERMASLGVRWVNLQVSVMQDTFYSTRIYKDFVWTPNDVELEAIINRFHKHGIRVIMRPVVNIHDSSWMGRIRFPEDTEEQISGRRPNYWGPWFDSLTDALLHYGRIAKRTHVELFCVGAEYNGTAQQSKRWSEVVRKLREVYDGPLTYEATRDELKNVPNWFRDLDLISFSFYYPAADKPGATVEEMVQMLQPSVEEMRKLSERLGRPIIFAEVGCRSRSGGAMVPGDFQRPGTYDGQEQANYMEAILRTFWDKPWWKGMYWWKWDEQQNRPQYHTDSTGDMGFTIWGKPAAETMKRWYSRTDRP